MYCSNCGEKQNKAANFCNSCGSVLEKEIASEEIRLNNSMIDTISIGKFRKPLIAFLLAEYLFLLGVLTLQSTDPYYYVNFFPYGLFQVLTIGSAIMVTVLVYKLSSLLNKPTAIIIFYTIAAPFILINLIPFVGLLADSKKVANGTPKY